MIAPQAAQSLPRLGQEKAEVPSPGELLALRRRLHFSTFLREELERCRTDIEREVVLSALLATQVQIRRILGNGKPMEGTEA